MRLSRKWLRWATCAASAGGLYLCEGFGKADGAEWRRICTEDDLSAYYTKAEFDEKYVQHVGLVSELVSGRLYEFSEGFKARFVTKAEAQEWLDESSKAISGYIESAREFAEWRESEQARADAYAQEVAALSARVEEMAESQASALSSWASGQEALISGRLQGLDALCARPGGQA